MTKRKRDWLDRVGKTFKTTEGYTATIIEYNGWYDSTIRLNDGTILKNIIYVSLSKGQVKNPNHRTKYGVGYFGQGDYKSIEEHSHIYIVWNDLMQRCYRDSHHKKFPTYKDCEVAEEWHNFQNFAKWFEENHDPKIMEDWDLDKDMIKKGNRIYGPETCCFIPKVINNLFATSQIRRGANPIGVRFRKDLGKYQARVSRYGKRYSLGHYFTPQEAFQAYKEAKEKYIKEVADEYKDVIDERVHNTLINHKVQITD